MHNDQYFNWALNDFEIVDFRSWVENFPMELIAELPDF